MRRTPRSRRAVGLTAAALLLLVSACTGAKAPRALTEQSAPPDATADASAPGATAPSASAAASASASAAASRGTTQAGGRTTAGPGGTRVPAGGGGAEKPRDVAGDLNLFPGALNTRGISNDEIVICGHAALTYGPAFGTSEKDFRVFWDALNARGGIYGRKVTFSLENDNYEPTTAVQAATTCQGKNPFAILGGIGFDQIPAVRNWAEQHKELYLYHDATANGAAGKQYSFSSLPTVERFGEMFAQLAVAKFRTKKIGILYRNSEFWDPGYKAFMKIAKAEKLNVVAAIPVENKQEHYDQEMQAMRDKGAEVVWAWENALAATEIINQAPPGYRPSYMVFPFNLTTQTLLDSGLDLYGIASWPAYSYHDYSGDFASYVADIKEFEQQYAAYDSSIDLSGVGGDLLFLNWVGQKELAQRLFDCGRACTRNHFATLLTRYRGAVRPNCYADFAGRGGHLGGSAVNLFHSYTGPSGKLGWKPLAKCVNTIR
ncbi:MAG: ABC transporter substrate-binding protein [Mycobacteriales bacterium]|nr:ABC transporter substrate-binding protein [Frankia sp.]